MGSALPPSGTFADGNLVSLTSSTVAVNASNGGGTIGGVLHPIRWVAALPRRTTVDVLVTPSKILAVSRLASDASLPSVPAGPKWNGDSPRLGGTQVGNTARFFVPRRHNRGTNPVHCPEAPRIRLPLDLVTSTALGIGVSRRPLALLLIILLPYVGVVCGHAAETNFAARIAALIDPSKLATLRAGAANPRLQKAVFLLEEAKRPGDSVAAVAAQAVRLAGYTNREAANLTTDSLVRNHGIAEKLGCLTREGLAEMRQGKAPTVTLGPYKGEDLSVDHIIPKSVAPELDRIIANLELLPIRLNQRKSDSVGERQVSLARKLHRAGLLSKGGLARIERAALP